MSVQSIEKIEKLLAQYKKLVLKWNKRIPLISRRSPGEALDRLVQQSLEAAAVLPKTIRTLIDIGSGSGIPGIPITICNEIDNVVLIDRSANKTIFLKNTVATLRLNNIEVINDSFNDEFLKRDHPLAVTSLGVGGYEELTMQIWPGFHNGDGVLLFISKELADAIAGNVSHETYQWASLKNSLETGVAWISK